MGKNFAVIGCGRFGRAVATTLYDLGHDVLAIDNNEEIIQDISDKVTKAVVANPEEHSLKEIGLSNCDVVIISIGSNIESSVITTLIVKELGVPYVICKASTEVHEKILYKIGADSVISPERDTGIKLAKNLSSENILEKIDLDPEYTIFEIVTPKSWIGKSLVELDIRKIYSLNVVAIKEKNKITIAQTSDMKLQKDNIILLVGHNDDLKEFERKMNIKLV